MNRGRYERGKKPPLSTRAGEKNQAPAKERMGGSPLFGVSHRENGTQDQRHGRGREKQRKVVIQAKQEKTTQWGKGETARTNIGE